MRRGSDLRRRELGGPDPLDRRLGAPPAAPLGWLLRLLMTRSALGLAPSLTPAVIFLPIGALLGPHGFNLIAGDVLAYLDLVVTTALAVLGVFVGTALGREVKSAASLVVAASVESGMTVAAVTAATLYFVRATGVPLDMSVPLAAVILGLAASASSATSADPHTEPGAGVATRVADLDDALPILLMAVVFALLPVAPGERRWLLAIAPVLAGLAVGAIGWLLFDRAESAAERGVFVLGAIAIAGGAAAYLRTSPLTVGLVAGLCWTLAPGRADRIVQDDLQKLQHPLVALLLLTAGALATPTAVGWWLLAPFLLFRLAGKVAGAWASARMVGDVRPGDLAAYLMPPGVIGIAVALNFQQWLPTSAGDALLFTTALGTAAFEMFALAILPRWRGRAG